MKFDGRKTGWAPSTEIRKDDDGLENIQDFFQEFPEEERRPQEFYYDEYEGFNRFDKEFPRENYRYEGEYQYQERPIRMPIQVPVMRSPFVYEEPIRVQVTPQYVPRRSVPGSVPVRRVYQSPVYQQAPPKRYPPNPYLNQPQPGIYKNYAEPPRSQPRPRRTPGRDEEYWRQKESEESEESDSKLVIPLQIEAPPSPVKYSPVKHSPRPTASSSRSVQQKQPKKKSAPAPKKVEALEEEEDVQPFRKRLGMTNRMKPTKTMPKPAPTLTAEVLEKDAVYTPLKESPELTVEEVVEEKLEAPVEIATPPVVHSAKKVDELDTKVNPSLLEIQKPVSIATPAVGDGAPVSTVKAVAEKIADSEGIVALEAPVPVQFAEEPIKKNSKAKSTKMIISSSEDDNDAPVAEPSFSKPEPKKDSGSHGRFEKSLELQEDVVPATQFESQSTNNFPNEDFNDDFGSPSGYPQYEPKAVVDSDENVSPTRSYANSDRSAIENSPVRPPPKKKSQNEIVKKTTKPKSVKPKKEKAVVKSEFKRPHPVAPVVVHVERPVIDESDTARRSKRAKIAPVAFWKNEKVIYSRRESGIALQDVIRIPSDDEGYSRPRKLKSKPREKTVKVKKEKEREVIPPPPAEIQVVNYATKQEEYQRIAVTPEMLETNRTVGAGEYKFQKVFSEGEFIASGVLELPVGARKPNKNSHSSAMVFIVMSGLVEIQVHTSIFRLEKGGQFFVPRGNQYSIMNVGQEDSTLIFCHGKQIA